MRSCCRFTSNGGGLESGYSLLSRGFVSKWVFVVLLMSAMLASCFAIACFMPVRTATAATTQTVTIQGTYHQTEAHKVLGLVNEFRTNKVTSKYGGNEPWCWNESDSKRVECKGLGKLTWDYSLEKIAMQRAAEISATFSHTRPDGSPCFTAKDGDVQTHGENIASGMGFYEDAESVFVGWREDNDSYGGQGHRRNMLEDGFTSFAAACFEVNGAYFWVQEFGFSNSKTSSFGENNAKTNVQIGIDSDNEELSYGLGNASASVAVGKEFSLPEKLTGSFEPWKGIKVPFSVEGATFLWKMKSGSDCVSLLSGFRYKAKAAGTVVFEASALGKTATYKVVIASPNPAVTPTKPAAKPSTPKVSTPKGTSLTKVSKSKKAFAAKWEKGSGIAGYQLRWSTKFNMSGAKSATVKSAKTTSKKVTKLKKKTKYYVQVRTYKVVNGKTYWSGWSKTKSVKTK